jgi:hypothetical protein
VPVANEDTDNVESRGESDFQYGSQKLLNAAMSLVLLNAAGSSNKKTMVDWAKAGRGKDFDDFKNDWALPNAIVDLNSDPTTGKFPVQHVGPDPLNPAFFGLVQFFAQDLQFASSIHSIRTGDPSDAPETVGALRTLGRWADDTLRVRRNRHELAIERVFNILLQWTPYHYVFHKFFEITNEESNLNETYQINVPFWNEYTKSWELMNDMTAIKAHYRIRIGSTTQSNNIAESQMLMQMMNQYPSLAKHVIRRMPEFKPHEKQEIIQDMDMLAQAQQRVKSLEDSIRQMQGELARRQQNIEALAKSNEMKNFQLKLATSKKSQPQQEIFLPQ